MNDVLLSEAVSRVRIDSAKLQSPLLSVKDKRNLRLNILKDYINNKPFGTRIRTKEFQEILRFKTNANAWAYIEKLVSKGIIDKHEIGPRSFFYTVPKKVTLKFEKHDELAPKATGVYKPLPSDENLSSSFDVVEPPSEPWQSSADDIIGVKQYTMADIENKAMSYLWYQESQGYAHTLAGFIKWLKSQED